MVVADLQTQLEVCSDKIEEIRAPDIASLTGEDEVRTETNGNIGSDHLTRETDHVTLESNHVTLEADHVTLEADHVTLESDHVMLEANHVTERLEEDTAHVQEEGNPVRKGTGPLTPDILGSENVEDNGPSPLVPDANLSSDAADLHQPVDHGSSADLECESETNPEVKCCPHSHQFVNDLSSEVNSSGSENETQDITLLRRQRRQKKRRKRQQRLKKCCSGCDSHGNVEPISPDLPSPIARSSGMLQCNVIKSFDEVVSTRYNSEEEIDAAIQSYSTVGSRLANQSEQTFSDVDIAANKSRSECGSPCSDTDLLVCDYSNSVGRKLANRSSTLDDELDGCIGGYLLDTLNKNLDPSSRLNIMTPQQLSTLIHDMNLKLQMVNEALVEEVKENDGLKAHKSVITKHISQLTRLAQGKRANDCSAFRKIVVTRETDI